MVRVQTIGILFFFFCWCLYISKIKCLINGNEVLISVLTVAMHRYAYYLTLAIAKYQLAFNLSLTFVSEK